MFKFNYKLRVVNAQKGVVSLQPTIGTYAKAFAPWLIVIGGFAAVAALEEFRNKSDENENETFPNL